MNFFKSLIKKRIRFQGVNTSIALALALVGAAIYLAFSIHFANTQRSTIDEGLYLYKGYLFASGTYHPFQDNGPRTEYGPLSFLIPGYIQLWFGPGLLTGRTFAIIIGILALLGLWAAARRIAGPWWGAAAVWAVALNPAVIRFYSFGLSQGLVTCLLMWMLFFALGKDHSAWQVSLSAVFAGLILLTRQNMAPALPVLLVYTFWQFGRKLGFLSTLAGIFTLVVGHAFFWPEILEIWVPWLPASLTPFLDAWRIPAGLTPILDFQPNWVTRLYNLLEGFRFHFIALVGSIIGLVLWPARKTWKSEHQFRLGVFLAVLFFSLLGLHIWAGLGFGGINFGNAFTVNPYMAFFAYSGLLFTIAVFSNFQNHLSVIKQIVICALVILISAGIGYGSFLNTGDILLNLRIPRILSFFTTGKILPGIVPLWDFLANRFGIPYAKSRWMVPLLAGFLSGLLVILIGFAIRAFLKRKKFSHFYSFGAISVIVFLLGGVLLSPTISLGGGFTQWDCSGNVIKTYEQAGKELAGVLSPGDLVYWDGGNAVAVLLYTPGIHLQPQELDWQWNYFLNGDSEDLSRLGLWNTDLAERWRQEANVIILQNGFIDSDWQTFLDQNHPAEILNINEFLNCSPDSFLEVIRLR
jgi:hypothetical protein